MTPKALEKLFLKKRTKSETPRHALKRLQAYADAGKKAGFQEARGELTPKLWKRLSASRVKALEKEFQIEFPPSVRRFLLEIGQFTVQAPNASGLRTECTREGMDYDHDKRVHESPEYAPIYGMTAKKFDVQRVVNDYCRITIANLFIEDENEHEDGDVATLVIERKRRGQEVPVWHIPEEAGYEIEKAGKNFNDWVSNIVDRLIHVTYLFWAGLK